MSMNVRVNIDLSSYEAKFEEAQRWLGERVLQDCLPKVPIQTGSQRQRSNVGDGGRRIEFPGPYARFLYDGKVMVDPETDSPWARKGVVKVSTERPLIYSDPGATDHWFEAAKAEHGQKWMEDLKKKIGGR
jgi:hypothetical protein